MSEPLAVYEEMKQFVRLDEQDVQNLKRLAPLFAQHGAAITDAFYTRLGEHETTAAFIAGRVDALKATHTRWMGELFAGDYGEAWFRGQLRVGQAHVRIGLDPWWVEGVMSFLRVAASGLIHREVPDVDEAAALYASVLKILDLDMLLINTAYAEDRLDRLTSFTGISRRLIEKCIRQG